MVDRGARRRRRGRNSPSRAAAYGTREPERIEPFSAAKMLIIAAMETALAAPGPREDSPHHFRGDTVRAGHFRGASARGNKPQLASK